ncbi:MAG: hypothetical protein ACPLXR_09595, partial [Halothiobacillaceae bacterium]
MDKKALRECRQLAQELFSKMEEAREIGDHARIEEIEKEMVALTKAGAMRDLALYREIAPQNITFDGSHKIYRIGQAFSPLFDHAPQRVLSALALGFGDGVNGPATPLQPLLPCDKHFHAWYRREGGRRSCTWVKNRLQEAGVVKKAPGRGKHRKRRARAAWPGMMLHQDASRHEWVAGRFAPIRIGCPRSWPRRASPTWRRPIATSGKSICRPSMPSSRSLPRKKGQPLCPGSGAIWMTSCASSMSG